jgi:hypothetical protein
MLAFVIRGQPPSAARKKKQKKLLPVLSTIIRSEEVQPLMTKTMETKATETRLFCLVGLFALAIATTPKVEGAESSQSTLRQIDAIGDAQRVCNSSTDTFDRQVRCIKRVVNHSDIDPSSPAAELYMLTVGELADEVESKSKSAAAARIELQESYLRLRQQQVLTAEAEMRIEALRQQEEHVTSDAAANERLRTMTAQQEAARAVAIRNDAVQTCVSIAKQRREQALNSPDVRISRAGNIDRALRTLAGDDTERQCTSNPNWYQTVPVPPAVTTCDSRGQTRVVCTTQ